MLPLFCFMCKIEIPDRSLLATKLDRHNFLKTVFYTVPYYNNTVIASLTDPMDAEGAIASTLLSATRYGILTDFIAADTLLLINQLSTNLSKLR